jgi:hypothetical protein
MKKLIVMLSLALLTAAASLAPITADARGTCEVFNEFHISC